MSPAPVHPPSVMDPEGAAVARAYARALLGLLGEEERASEVAGQLARLAQMLDEIEGFEEFLQRMPLTLHQRGELVDRAFADRVDPLVEGLLGVMARNNRLGLLRGVAGQFAGELNRRRGTVEATVVTAVPLDDAGRRDVVETLVGAVGAKVVLTEKVDPRLLGGLVVQIGDDRYDASVARELERMRLRFSERLARTRPVRSSESPDMEEGNG